MNKKGQIEVQFNWIYIAVVGGIILLVFLSIANGIRNRSRTSLEIDAINYFDEIFTSLQGSENTEHSITLPGLEIEVASYADNCYEYSIKDSEFGRRRTEYVPIFSPDTIKTRVLSYSLGWDVPFRANYFLYLTSPDVKYVFVGDNPDLFSLHDDMPNNFPSEPVFSSLNFRDQNYYKIRFVSFDNPENFNLHNSVRNHKDTTAVRIIPSGELYEGGEIIYYVKEGNNFVRDESTYYFDKPSLIAAIYSERAGSYECNMEKAFMRMNKIASLVKKRTNMLIAADLRDDCVDSLYEEAVPVIRGLEGLTWDEAYSDSSRLLELKTQLKDANKNIIDESCPRVY